MSKQVLNDTEKMILASEMILAEYQTNGWVFFDPISKNFRICSHEIAECEFLRLFELVYSLNIVANEVGIYEVSDKPVNHYIIWLADGMLFPVCDADGILIIDI